MMKDLNPLQIALDKTTLIEASAGTGKTYTITTLFCRLVAAGYLVENILVVTFTEAAAAELKIRIRDRIAGTLKSLSKAKPDIDDELSVFLSGHPDVQKIQLRLRTALSSFDQASVMTIHSFCLKILKENAFESHSLFDVELVADQSAFFKQVCYDFFMARINGLDSIFLKFLEKRQFDPETIAAQFSGLVGRQDLTIIPATGEFKDVSNAYKKTLKSIKEMIVDQRDQILETIAGNKGVDKRSYTKKNLPNWLDQAIAKFEKEGENALFFMTEKGDSLYKFSSQRLAEKTKKGSPPDHPFFDLCQQLVEDFHAFERELMNLKKEFFIYFDSKLEAKKMSDGICFFDDLINDVSKALDDKSGNDLKKAVRTTYKACLIDEFQDTDPNQYHIFSSLFNCPGTPFFMVGDPKQAIYAFRGGDIFAYLKAVSISQQQSTLMRNYRSSPKLVEGVNSFFSGKPDPFLFEKIGFTSVSTPPDARNLAIENGQEIEPVRFCFLGRDDENVDRSGFIKKEAANKMIPQLVATDIIQLLESDIKLLEKKDNSKDATPVNPGDIAVLVRTNAQAQLVQGALASRKIPSYLSKSGSVFDSNQAVELYQIICAVLHPENTGYMKTALATSVFGLTCNDMIETDEQEGIFFQWQDRFFNFKKIWDRSGFVSMIFELLHSSDAFLNVRTGLNERGMTNFYHLVELISQAFIKEQVSPYHLLKWYTDQLSVETRNETADQLRLSSDKKAVAIVTIHKSKGLEYPIVYLPYLWDDSVRKESAVLFHDPEKNNRLTLDLGSSDFESSQMYSQAEKQSEQRRLLYVALTRASALCKIIWGGFKSVDSSALGSLIHSAGCKDDSNMLTDLKAQQACAPKSISIELVSLQTEQKGYKEISSDPIGELAEQKKTTHIQPGWKIASFSSITHESEKEANVLFESKLEPDKGEKTVKDLNTLADFPKGASTGDFFHGIFETMDFTIQQDRLLPIVETIGASFGISDPKLIKTATIAVSEVTKTPLDFKQDCFCLNQIKNINRFTELEFAFPVKRFNIQAIKEIFGQPDSDHDWPIYQDKLNSINENEFKGFIKGFIDLVVEYKGKWFIIDYKTNYLGPGYTDYTQDAIFTAMCDHHYILQYHIYLIALHQYLKLRLKGYEYDQHFGGVFYLFTRGMHPEQPKNNGVFFHRPVKKVLKKILNSMTT